MRWQLLMVVFVGQIVGDLLGVLPEGPVKFPGGEGARGPGGFRDAGVNGVDYVLPFWAQGVPRVMPPVAVYTACSCGAAPLVLVHTPVRGVASGADSAGLAALAPETGVTKPLTLVASHGLFRIVLQLE